MVGTSGCPMSVAKYPSRATRTRSQARWKKEVVKERSKQCLGTAALMSARVKGGGARGREGGASVRRRMSPYGAYRTREGMQEDEGEGKTGTVSTT